MMPVSTTSTGFVRDNHGRSTIHVSSHILGTPGKEGASKTLVFSFTSLRYVVMEDVTDWTLSHPFLRNLLGIGWFLLLIRQLVIGLGFKLG